MVFGGFSSTNQYNDRKVSPPRPPSRALSVVLSVGCACRVPRVLRESEYSSGVSIIRNERDVTSHTQATHLLRPHTHTVWKTYTFGSEAAMTTQLAACEPWAGAHAEPALRPGVATCGQACATMRTRTGRATAGLRS